MPSPTLITVSEADAILGNAAPWVTSSDIQKDDALGWAEVYFLSVYSCPNEDFTDTDNIDSSVKEGLALLGNEHLIKSLFERQTGRAAVTEESKEVVGAVKTMKKYAQSTGGKFQDQFTHVTALLSPICCITKGQGSSTSSLGRI